MLTPEKTTMNSSDIHFIFRERIRARYLARLADYWAARAMNASPETVRTQACLLSAAARSMQSIGEPVDSATVREARELWQEYK